MDQLQTIEKVKDAIFERLSYTNQDYNSIITELINLLPQISPNWNNVSEADIIFIMLSLMAAHKDILNYMVDYRVLESYMSTAKERQSLVRIANSFGYKIPSYKAAKATIKTESATAASGSTAEATLPFTLPSWTRIVDANNISWSYVGPNTTITIDDNINVYQGIPTSINISIANIDDQTKTHIISNQSIAIGNNADTTPLSKLVITKDGEDDVIFTEVENIYTDTSGSTLIYHLAVDPQGITYIKLPDTFNKADYAGFTATFFYVLTQGQNITSISNSLALLDDADETSYNVNFIEPVEETGFNFVLGSRPFTAPEIREGFKQYYAGVNSLVTLEDYKSFILNKQKAVLGIEKCLVIDSQTSTLEGLNGNPAFFEYPGIYVLKENNEVPTNAEIDLLRAEVDKFKVTGVIPGYNGEVGNAISAVPVQIQINKLPPESTQAFKDLVAGYINNKEIGAPLTSSEILSLIQNSQFAPNFASDGLAIKLVIPNVTESTQRINIAYHEYMTCNPSTGITVNTSL